MMIEQVQVTPDMHSADIIAALKKRGTSIAQLSRESGLAGGSLRNALYRSCPKYERIIALALDKEPSQVWPSRYNVDICQKAV